MTRVRSDMVQAQHGPRGRRASDFLKRVGMVSDAINGDTLGKGAVLAFSTSPRMPAALTDVLKDDRRWTWVPCLGGLIRLADVPYEGGTAGLHALQPGDFFQDGSKGRIPGFGASQHPQWGWIKVRLPSDGVLLGQGVSSPAAPPAPSEVQSEPGLAIRTEARDLMFKMEGYTTAHRDWAMEAPIDEVRQWLKAAKEGGQR